MASAKPVRITTVSLHNGSPVMALALDEDRGLVYSGDTSGRIVAWHLPKFLDGTGRAPTGEPVFELKEEGAVYSLITGRKGKTDLLIAGGAFGRLSVYGREKGQDRTHLPLAGVEGAVRDLQFTTRHGWLYAVTQQGQLAAFEIETGKRLLAESTGMPGSYSVSARDELPPNTAMVAVGGSEGTLTFFQHGPGGLTRIRSHNLGEQVIYDTTFVHSNEYVAPYLTPGVVLAGSDGNVYIQGELDPTPLKVGEDKGQTYALAVTPDGRYVLTGGEADVVAARDLKTNKVVHKIKGHSGTVWKLALTADGKFGLIGDAAGNVHVYDLASLVADA